MMALAHFFMLPGREQRLIVEAVLSLLAYGSRLQSCRSRRHYSCCALCRANQAGGRVAAAEACEVGRAIVRAARYVPFRAVWLQQAFAALLILRRRGLAATVHLGLAREAGAGTLKAHAWCRCGELPVTGVVAAHGFVAIAAFMA